MKRLQEIILLERISSLPSWERGLKLNTERNTRRGHSRSLSKSKDRNRIENVNPGIHNFSRCLYKSAVKYSSMR